MPPAEEVRSARLVLRRLQEDDAGPIAAAVAASLEHLRPWMPWATPEAGQLRTQLIRVAEAAELWAAGTDYIYSVLLQPGRTLVGQIGLTRFINKAGLQPVGDNLFTETPASGPPQDGIANTDGLGDMQQSNLEQANVEVVSEISDLIAAQRAYEMNAKVISAADQMMQSTTALFR